MILWNNFPIQLLVSAMDLKLAGEPLSPFFENQDRLCLTPADGRSLGAKKDFREESSQEVMGAWQFLQGMTGYPI